MTYKSFALCDVVLTQFAVEGGNTYNINTADEISCELSSEDAESTSLTIKKRTIAKKDGVDLVKGYDLKLKDNVFTPDLVADLQGGRVTKDTQGNFQSYTAPTVGVAPTLKSFTTSFFIEVVGEDGPTGEYLKYTFSKCKGSLLSPNFKDDEYYSSEYTVKSRPTLGTAAYTVTLVNELPSGATRFVHPALAIKEDIEEGIEE